MCETVALLLATVAQRDAKPVWCDSECNVVLAFAQVFGTASAALCGIIDRERRRRERSGAPRSDAYAPVVTVARADWLRSDGDDAIAVRRSGCGIRSRRAMRDV